MCLCAYVKKTKNLDPGAYLSMIEITNVFPEAGKILMKNDVKLVNWGYNSFDIREDDLMEVLSKEIFSEKDPNELRVAIVSEIRRVAPASFFYILI